MERKGINNNCEENGMEIKANNKKKKKLAIKEKSLSKEKKSASGKMGLDINYSSSYPISWEAINTYID
jgi:hypothetical protein